MPKLTRYLQKIFANNSDQVGVFGTGVDKETSKNVETLQSADYENGWSSAIITNKNYPIWQEMDGVQYGLSYQLKYLFQNGIPEWISTETYYTNSYCRIGSNIYYSLQDDNINHNPALNDGWWTLLLNSKADVDLTNVTDAGYIKMGKASMPSNTYIDLTLGASGTTYTAPADGWFYADAHTNVAGQQNGFLSSKISVTSNITTTSFTFDCYAHIPVTKGDEVQYYYTQHLQDSISKFRFYYAVGSESEAS